MRRDRPIITHCWICKTLLPLSKGSRHRLTCSPKCRQKRYRRLKGQMSWQFRRERKLIDDRRSVPFVERRFNKDNFRPVLEMGYKRSAYECMACGRVYVVEKFGKGAKVSPFCSERCAEIVRMARERFTKGLDRLWYAGEEIDSRVLARMALDKLSPLCPHCKKPFAPNSTLNGDRKPGRPRIFCSAKCRKNEYERRWKMDHEGRARLHRYMNCAECGQAFDRTDRMGRFAKRFCKRRCAEIFTKRAYLAREAAKAKGRTEVKYGFSGHGSAARGAQKNQRNAVSSSGAQAIQEARGGDRKKGSESSRRNTLSGDSSGGAAKQGAQALIGGVESGIGGQKRVPPRRERDSERGGEYRNVGRE